MSVYVNRVLNLKKIKAIGFDMDYTIVRYKTKNFEGLVHQKSLEKLVKDKSYPPGIAKLKFDYKRSIQGLVIDMKHGNLLKLSRFGKVKSAYHGTKSLTFKEQKEIYGTRIVDLNDPHIQSLDTSFSLSYGIIYSQLVELKKTHRNLPDFQTMNDDIKWAIDVAHADGTLKNEVRDNISKYILQDPGIPATLEKLKKHGKKLLVITNSDYAYTRLLLDYTFNPYLKDHESWRDLFEIVITASQKPRFFTANPNFLSIEPESGLMYNPTGPIVKGLYQGGNAVQLQQDLKLTGEEILYLGDHIFGDVVSLKKTCNWRTALVLDPLAEEVESLESGKNIKKHIESLMKKKTTLERKLNREYDKQLDKKSENQDLMEKLYAEIKDIDKQIAPHLKDYQKLFNPYWGEMMRAGNEESRFAGQLGKYACIYMAKISDLGKYSPRTYFRPNPRVLPHEL